MGTIRISPDKQQLIGVKYGQVELARSGRQLRALGKVSYDETRIAKVQARIDGWIDKVFVDFTGQLIEKGQPLLTIYSPEMLASQQEYLLALRSKDILNSSPIAGNGRQAEALIAAARKRLELLELSQPQISQIEATGKPLDNVTLNAPIRGYVVERNAFPNQRITPDTILYTVVDLNRVWIMAELCENEAATIRLGQPAVITGSHLDGSRFLARVTYIQPQLDPMTRTLKIRLEAENPRLELKPEMFVDAQFDIAGPDRLTVPIDAVLDSGLAQTVFVDLGNGYLEPRPVETGNYLGDRVEIRKGLKLGERIVVAGTFLVDSESRLKAAAAAMAGHQHGAAGPDQQQASDQPSATETNTSRRSAGGHKHD